MRDAGIDLEVGIYSTKLADEPSPHVRTETDPVSETSRFYLLIL
jgi:hypothetical protein